MNLTIDKIRIAKFKGIDNETFEFGGQNASIYGDNATGKTTIFDAFLWLLFGKDSTDRSTFGVKPYDSDGNEIHNLETSVEADFFLDGKPLSLRHVMTENWVKQRGQSERVFQGNVHSYHINDEPTSATEYKKFIDSLVGERVFRQITNPLAFNALHWEERRSLLLDLSPIRVDEILLGKAEYQPIAGAMAAGQSGIESVKKSYNKNRKRLAEELEALPIQIAEVKRLLGYYDQDAVDSAVSERESLTARIGEIDRQLSDARALASLYEAEMRKLAKARNDLNQREQSIAASTGLETAKAKRAVVELEEALRSIDVRMARIIRERDVARERKQKFSDDAQKRRDEWHKEKAVEVVFDQPADTCAACRQALPAEEVQAAADAALALATKDKESRLASIADTGKRLVAQAEEAQSDIERLEKQLDETTAEYEGAKKQRDALLSSAQAPVEAPDFKKDIQWIELSQAVSRQEERLNGLVSGGTASGEISEQKSQIMKRLNELADVIASKDKTDLCNDRIAELEARQRECGDQIADVEKIIILIEKFVTERCGMLEDNINALFPTVKWRLFETQINGGIKDDCTCMINGVPFSDANNAARINAGIEIINVLNSYYGATVPVFCDNAEAVTELRQTAGQRISLIVSKDKQLRIEIEKSITEVA